MRHDFLEAVSQYYSKKIRAHGPVPKGVDWKDAESQRQRFEQFLHLFKRRDSFSLNDLGCGYGALLEFLDERGDAIEYRGYDVSSEMIETARSRHVARPSAVFALGACPANAADYSVASGIFNVKGDVDDRRWLEYVHDTLDDLNQFSIRGFAFNCLSLYSDVGRRRADLYYADPRHLFDRCMNRYSRNVALLHDYGLYEFTLVVRKNGKGSA